MRKILSFFCLLSSLSGITGENLIEEHYVPMNDGVKLYTVVAYPEKGKKLPVIITRNPYAQKEDSNSSCFPYYQLHSNFKGNQALQTKTQVARNTIITGKSFLSVPFSPVEKIDMKEH